MRSKFAAIAGVLAIVVSMAVPGMASAADDTAPCADATIVFARGSGQTVGESGKEAERFFQRIDERADADVRLNSYELGASAQGGHQYDAVGIGFDSAQYLVNMVQADASWVPFGQYTESVTDGVAEATTYLTARAARCTDEVFMLGGYSQGAQVMGNAIAALDPGVRDQIVYVGLFGDPKLYLPEGEGILPSACRGGELSPWRRGNVSCFTDNGVLEARKPYLPSDIEDRVGSWCDREDPICNTNLADIVGSTHDQYRADGNGVDQAVREAVAALARRRPDLADDLNIAVLIIGSGTTGLDVAFVIDTTGSMADDIAAARAVAGALAAAITDLRGRVALTEYRDAGDPFVAAVRSPLSDNIGQFQAALAPLSADGGGDTPEALLSALMTTLNGLDWRDGATKAAIVLTDAGYHDPDVADGWTLSQVTARALEIDPVNVYAVVPPSEQTTYAELTSQTAGRVMVNAGDTQAALLAAITEIRARPTALLKISEYWAAPGSPVTFDASDSYDPDSTLTSFDWDFNGDGTIDDTTTDPTASHIYPADFEGMAEVRVHSIDGGVANAVAAVHINPAGLAGLVPDAPTDAGFTVSDPGPDRTVTLQWTSATTGGSAMGWQIHDGAGRLLGQSTTTTMKVSSVPDDEVTFTISGVNEFGAGAPASVTVPAVTGGPGPTGDPSTPPGDPGPGPGPGSTPSGPAAAPTELGRTGASLTPSIVAGAGLILVGIAIVVLMRRRRALG